MLRDSHQIANDCEIPQDYEAGSCYPDSPFIGGIGISDHRPMLL